MKKWGLLRQNHATLIYYLCDISIKKTIKMKTQFGEEEDTPFTKTSIIKNLVVVALGSMLLLGSDDVLLAYQSTLNPEGGKGIASIFVQFSVCGIASFFLPKYFILRFGCKATMVLGGLGFIPFFVSNFYPIYSFMVTSSVSMAVGYAMILGAVDPYINDLAFLYDKVCAAEKSSGPRASLSVDLTKESVVCTAYEKLDIDRIHCTCPKRDCIGNIYKIDQTNDCIKGINVLHQNYLSRSLCWKEILQTGRKKICLSTEQISCICNKKHEIDSKSKCLQNLGHINIENICKVHPKSSEIEESCRYPSDIFVKNNHAAHSNIVDQCIKNIPTVSQIVYNEDIKKEQQHIFYASKCESEYNKTKEKSTVQCPQNNSKAKHLESIAARFFGFHSMIYQTCYFWSSLVSFFVLQNGFTGDSSIAINETCLCGASFCNVENACEEYNLRQPTPEARISLISVCVALCVVACVVLFLLLDDLKPKDKNVSLSLHMLLASYRQMQKRNQILLAPLTMYIGMMKGFFLVDFTKSYVGCAWGISHTGLVTACAGATMAITSSVSGLFVKYMGRLPIFVTAAGLNVGLNVLLLVWLPNSNLPSMFFVTSGLWGALFGIFHTQVRAFYGILFRKDEQAAFGVYLIWYCIGSCLSLGLSNFICNVIKVYLLMAVSSLGVIGYLAVERSHGIKNKTTSPSR